MKKEVIEEKEQYIVKYDKKNGCYVVFDLQAPANVGRINCIDKLEHGTLTSWSEASYDYYHSLKPCKDEKILEEIKKDFKKLYDVDIEFKKKLQHKTIKKINNLR